MRVSTTTTIIGFIDLGIHGEGFERIVYSDTEGEVDADNIMDFDKE